eukprot:6419259-Amphidinium_carterae.1
MRQARQYGDLVWPVLYQSDVRARLELAERIRRDAAFEKPRGFDAGKPWEYVFHRLIGDQIFWQEELHHPALLALTRTARLNTMLGQDAAIAGSTPPPAPASHKRPASSDHGAQRASTKPRSTRLEFREHEVSQDGSMRTNRRGVPLCVAFNRGECAMKDGVCPVDPSYAHQCSRCLSPHHPA